MKKIRMTITITDQYEVSTNFRGTSEEQAKCKRALARHLRDQAKAAAVVANAVSYVDEQPAAPRNTSAGSKEELPRRYA